jgi:hypothetical protein
MIRTPTPMPLCRADYHTMPFSGVTTQGDILMRRLRGEELKIRPQHCRRKCAFSRPAHFTREKRRPDFARSTPLSERLFSQHASDFHAERASATDRSARQRRAFAHAAAAPDDNPTAAAEAIRQRRRAAICCRRRGRQTDGSPSFSACPAFFASLIPGVDIPSCHGFFHAATLTVQRYTSRLLA